MPFRSGLPSGMRGIAFVCTLVCPHRSPAVTAANNRIDFITNLSLVTCVQMHGVLIVLVAYVLGHLKIGFEGGGAVLNPGFAVCAGVVDDDLDFQIAVVSPVESLGEMHLFGVRMPGHIDP